MTLLLPGNPVADENVQQKFDTISLRWPNSSVGAFSAYRSTARSINDAGTVEANAELFDVSGWYDAATNFRYTPKVPGYYRLSACVSPNAALTADNYWIVNLRKNAATIHRGQVAFQRGASTTISSVGSWLVQANGTTDFFDLSVSHNTGGATALSASSLHTYFHGEMVSP